MAMDIASISRGTTPKPARIVLYGVPGVGKTTLAAAAPNPIFIQTEDGGGALDYAHFPKPTSMADVFEAIGTLYSEPHDFKTLVVDTLDWLEPLIWAEACARNNWANIETPGYGKGYVAALGVWREYLDGIDALRNERGMMILQLAHSAVKRFDSPEHDPYDRYQIKLHDKSAALLVEHADAVLFANYRVGITKQDPKKGTGHTRAVGSGERVLHTAERPFALAKNRYGLPDQMPLDWAALAAVPGAQPAA